MTDTIPDFISYDYNEYSGVTKWYFGFKDMMEYYRLCRAHSRLCGVKLKDNLCGAHAVVEYAMDLDGYYGFAWTLHTGSTISGPAASCSRIDEDFNGEFDLLEALLSIADWYKCHLEPLRKAVEETGALQRRTAWR